MSVEYPKSDELSIAIINDCYTFLYSICNKRAKDSIQGYFKSK